MTKEELKQLYDRCIQIYIAKTGDENLRKNNDELHILSDGTICIKYETYPSCCGDPADYDYVYIELEDLSADLDVLVQQRKRKQAEEAIRREEKYAEEKRQREAREKYNRQQEYLKLKKEFE